MAWNLRRGDEVRALHAGFAQAGAEVVQTNTFGGSRARLARWGLDGEIRAILFAAVEHARAAGAPFVVASVGPTGIDPFSIGAAARMRGAFEEQIGLLAEAGVDGVHLETMYHPIEARAGIAASRAVAPSLPVIVSATYALGDLGFQTPYGVALPEMTAAILDGGPDAVGLNCSLEARKMLGALRALREIADVPILVKPQAGAPTVGCRGEYRGDDPDRLRRDGLKLVDEGADAIGGCCGATAEHIAALAAGIVERWPDALGMRR